MKHVVWVIIALIVIVAIVSLIRRDDSETVQQEAPMPAPVAVEEPEVVPEPAAEDDTAPTPVVEDKPAATIDVSREFRHLLASIPEYEKSTIFTTNHNPKTGRAYRHFVVKPVVTDADEDCVRLSTDLVNFYMQFLEDNGWEVGKVRKYGIEQMPYHHPLGTFDELGTPLYKTILASHNQFNFKAVKGEQSIELTVDQQYDPLDNGFIQVWSRGILNVPAHY